MEMNKADFSERGMKDAEQEILVTLIDADEVSKAELLARLLDDEIAVSWNGDGNDYYGESLDAFAVGKKNWVQTEKFLDWSHISYGIKSVGELRLDIDAGRANALSENKGYYFEFDNSEDPEHDAVDVYSASEGTWAGFIDKNGYHKAEDLSSQGHDGVSIKIPLEVLPEVLSYGELFWYENVLKPKVEREEKLAYENWAKENSLSGVNDEREASGEIFGRFDERPVWENVEMKERGKFLSADGDVLGYDYLFSVDSAVKDSLFPSLRELKDGEILCVRYRRWFPAHESNVDFAARIMVEAPDGTLSRPTEPFTKDNVIESDFPAGNAAADTLKAAVRNECMKIEFSENKENFLSAVRVRIGTDNNPVMAFKRVCGEWNAQNHLKGFVSEFSSSFKSKKAFDAFIRENFPDCRKKHALERKKAAGFGMER